LLSNGADVNAINNHGVTALMLAYVNGHKEIVRILKEAGAKE
jgi:ankyrin repeat protein